MLISLNTRSGVPIYRQLVDQLRRQILAGRRAAGDKLPSVRDLAGELKVNPMTVSKAYSLLEQKGLLDRRRGVGLFVRDLPKAAADRDREALLRQALDRAATLAIQLGIPRERAVELLREAIDDHQPPAGE